MPTDFSFDVFLSHNSRDKPRVRNLAKRLRGAGVRVWFDEWILQPGDDIYLAIERGLNAARTLVLCLSQAALESDWVELERSTVLFRDPSNAGRRFIPLLLADCELPDTLRRYKYVDFRQATKSAFEKLLTACRSEKPPAAHPNSTQIDRDGRLLPSKQKRASAEKGDLREVYDSGQWPAGFRLRHVLPGHERVITRLAWAPDGVRFASAGQDGVIRIWNTEAGSLLRELVITNSLLKMQGKLFAWPQETRAASVAWTPAWSRDGRIIACG